MRSSIARFASGASLRAGSRAGSSLLLRKLALGPLVDEIVSLAAVLERGAGCELWKLDVGDRVLDVLGSLVDLTFVDAYVKFDKRNNPVVEPLLQRSRIHGTDRGCEPGVRVVLHQHGNDLQVIFRDQVLYVRIGSHRKGQGDDRFRGLEIKRH